MLSLDQILSRSEEAVAAEAAGFFDSKTAPFQNQIVLFGAGQLGRKALAGLRGLNIEPVAFTDNNPALWNSSIEGVPVYSPADAAARFKDNSSFVVTMWSPGIRRQYCEARDQLAGHGCERIVPFVALFWKYPDVFLPHITWGLPQEWLAWKKEIAEVHSLWSDQESRDIYTSHWQWRMLLDFDALPPVSADPQYFPSDVITPRPGEVFVDCGAYDGDTVRDFLHWCQGDFERVYALEPDPLNVKNLQVSVSGLPESSAGKIKVLPFAVGSKREVVSFQTTGTASARIGEGDIQVQVVSLDEILAGEKPTYIKMDIEGFEPDALLGAKNAIERHRPRLAVCIYHELNHFWRLPLMMKQLCPEYSFFLRVHGEQGWDWVCYAIPKTP